MAQVQAQRTNTLDRFLDELPELSSGYFSFPVDDFFENYVEELGQRGIQNGSNGAAGPRPENGEYPAAYDAFSAQPNQARAPLGSAMSLDLPLAPDQLAPIVSLPDNPTTTPFANPGDALLGMPPISGRPDSETKLNNSEGSGSGVWMEAPGHAESRQRRPAAKQEYTLGEAALEDSDEAEQNKPKTGRGKTKRNAKQQVQNKQAQQRYRERRKQRFVEMEHTIDGLTAKVQQMQAIQSQNAMLQAKRDELEAMLREKEQELERLRAQVEAGAGSTQPAEERSLEQRRRAEEANLRECQAQVAAHVQVLREFIDKHGLRNVNPTGEGVDPTSLAQLAELVGRGCSMCQSAMRAEGVKVLRLMSRDVRHLSRIACLRECNKWSHILQTLQLTEQQEEQLLLMRKNHLRNLRGVYEARQQLNIQAMALMLPAAERSSSGEKDLEGKIACMSLRGYSRAALQSADLDEILNSIKENLRLEQKHVMEMNFVTMHRLLSPLQAALFLVEVHPQYCDALALANVLATVVEERTKNDENTKMRHLLKVDSITSQAGGERQSPASSETKSDTCPLLARELEANESHGNKQ